MGESVSRWLLLLFGIRDERVVCPECGRPMWRRPQMTPQERFVMGDITLEELERELERGS